MISSVQDGILTIDHFGDRVLAIESYKGKIEGEETPLSHQQGFKEELEEKRGETQTTERETAKIGRCRVSYHWHTSQGYYTRQAIQLHVFLVVGCIG